MTAIYRWRRNDSMARFELVKITEAGEDVVEWVTFEVVYAKNLPPAQQKHFDALIKAAMSQSQ